MKYKAIFIFLLVGFLTVGCGSKESTEATDALNNAAESATESIDKAKDAAGETVTDAVEAVEASSVKQCLELAAKKNWSDALAPCTEAAKEMPDDLSIKHALQQAKAAAEG